MAKFQVQSFRERTQQRQAENRAEAKSRRDFNQSQRAKNASVNRKVRQRNQKRGTGLKVLKGFGKMIKDVVNSKLAKNTKIKIGAK